MVAWSAKTFGPKTLRAVIAAVLAGIAAACGSEDRGITQPTPQTPPSVVFIHNTLNPPDDRASPSLESNSSYDFFITSGFSIFLHWIYDDFSSPVATAIRNVSWQGAYCLPRLRVRPDPPRAVSSSFRIAFHADDNGRPRTASSLYAVNLPPAEVRELFAFDAVWNESDCAYYDYTAVLPTPFPVAEGTRYWLLVRADTGHAGIGWGWRVGRADNNLSAQGTLRGLVTFPKDHAFSVSSQ